MKNQLTQTGENFSEILLIIRSGRAKAFEVVNLALMETYWAVGEHLSRKVAQAGWGKGVVQALALWLRAHAPEAKGFSAQNLWRMKQFHEAFSTDAKLSALPRVLSWTHNLIILSQVKHAEEREFCPSFPRRRESSPFVT